MPARSRYDAVVIGSGPNGLGAAIRLAQAGASVLVLEAREQTGGGTRVAESTLPGFRHDVCSAVHPMGVLSPLFMDLPLAEHGLRWIRPGASVAHPLDDQPAVMLWRDLDRTCEGLGQDGKAYRSLLAPFLDDPHTVLGDLLAPLKIPRAPFKLMRFGYNAIRSAAGLARGRFAEERARALFAGCAGHAIMPLEKKLTAALGMIFSLTGHVEDWPVAAGGSDAIDRALCSYFSSLGGEIETGVMVNSMADLPEASVYLFDTSPRSLSEIAGEALPPRYHRRLARYRYGPGVFKLDWALDGPIPWRDPTVLQASTVHVGGTLAEISTSESAMWRGEHAEHPFLILCQQSQFDDTRAPEGKHTGYAYCHVPHGSTLDMGDRIEAQVERFAPGFRDRILARHATHTVDFARYNRNYVGGAITGGVADLFQLFTRPVARLNPYTTPNRKIFICSAATPPGGGVHGMCGHYAAQAALRRI